MPQRTRISTRVSLSTRRALERFCESRGLELDFVVEAALLSFIEARSRSIDEASAPSRIVLGSAGFDRLVKLLKRPPKPTAALVELMRDR